MPSEAKPGSMPLATFGVCIEARLSRDIRGWPGRHSISRACSRPTAIGKGKIGRAWPDQCPAKRTKSASVITSGPAHSMTWPMVAGRSRLRTMASATSSTQTGWNRAWAPASGISGATTCSFANRLRNWSCAPKMTEGRNKVRSSGAARSTASPAVLLRR